MTSKKKIGIKLNKSIERVDQFHISIKYIIFYLIAYKNILYSKSIKSLPIIQIF